LLDRVQGCIRTWRK